MVSLTINGRHYSVDAEPDTPLLFVLRDTLGLTGTKYGCGIAQCGACTVHLDGQATRSCQVPLESVGTQAVTTIEAIEQDDVGRKVVEAWVALQVPQCGYCQSGMVMAAACAMKAGHRGSEIASELSNVCVCGTYQRIKSAVSTL